MHKRDRVVPFYFLQVVDVTGAGRLAMAACVLVAMVRVVVIFVVGNGAHKNAGLFALEGVK